MKLDMFDVDFDTRSGGGGTYGTSGRGSFTKMNSNLVLNGSTGDYLEVLIQDNLSTLNSFSINAQGALVQN